MVEFIVKVYEDYFKLADKIETSSIKEFLYKGIDTLPDDFWTRPTSSSGSHHPPESNTEPMGILVHSVKACTIAKVLMPFFGVDEQIDKDMIITALLLHDGFKGGIGKWDGMIPEHAYLASSILVKIDLEPKYIKDKLLKAIRTHMSRFGRPFSVVDEFLFPEKVQLIVALSDMVASGKDISFYPGISVMEEVEI